MDVGINLMVDGIHVLITDMGVTEKDKGGKTGIYFEQKILDGIPDNLETFRDKVETILMNRINLELDTWLDGKLDYE